MKIHSDSDFRDAWLEGAARAFFVTAYADHVEDCEREVDYDYPRPGPGEDWCDYAPETPANAYALAGELWNALRAANGEAGVYSLVLRAEAADGKAPDPELFGHYLAMQSMGHGVSWFDDHAAFPMVIPHLEVSQFTFFDSAYQGGE
jgi:hypothetical protein